MGEFQTFEKALTYLKLGNKITREGWNGKGMWIELQTPTELSKMTRSYLYMCIPKDSTRQFGEDTKEFNMVPWLPSQTDLLSEDWILI